MKIGLNGKRVNTNRKTMTAKEKAIELVDKMYSKSEPDFNGMSYYEAKDCAIVAVDEITKQVPTEFFNHDYWYSVIKEIEKL